MSIQVRDLTYIYNEGLPDETKALAGVGFDVYDGEIIGIIGRTGSGKSTLLQHLNGLIKPLSGTIVIDGVDITKPQVVLKDIRENVGLVFQYPEYQLFEETVKKDVAFGPANIGLSGEELEQRVRDSIELVGLDYDEIADRPPFDLSGGQKRRVAIAGVLAMDPHVLILDEPMAGLDPESHREIVEMIENIHKDRNRIIILVSHNMADVADLSDRVVMMDRSKVLSVAPPEELFLNRELLRVAGLDVPPVSAFMHELKAAGLGVRTNLFTEDEAAEEIAKALGAAGAAPEDDAAAPEAVGAAGNGPEAAGAAPEDDAAAPGKAGDPEC